jgi:hypothetical protein
MLRSSFTGPAQSRLPPTTPMPRRGFTKPAIHPWRSIFK